MWRRSRHPAESVAECACVGIAQGAGDLGDAHAGAEKQLPCDLELHFVQKLAERRAFRLQAAVQRPRMHRQAARDGLLGEVAEEDARAKEPNDLVGGAGERDRPVFRDQFFQDRALAGIGAGHRTFQLARGENERRLLGVEPDRT